MALAIPAHLQSTELILSKTQANNSAVAQLLTLPLEENITTLGGLSLVNCCHCQQFTFHLNLPNFSFQSLELVIPLPTKLKLPLVFIISL